MNTNKISVDILTSFAPWEDLTQFSPKEECKNIFKNKEIENFIDTECEISIVLESDENIQVLNRDYRGKDKPTNVLSFPQDEEMLLGDIVLAYETIEREAREAKISFRDHFIHLVVHGFLHLIGYDHETDEEAEEMEQLEIDILESMGVKNPYQTE